jgi:8-oxo-dGTP diphosphatase
MPAEPRLIVVLAAVIERNGRFLVTRRTGNTHLAGYWEFPGGKCEDGESHPDCLARELREELNTRASVGPEILQTEHHYPDRSVRLHFRSCQLLDEPEPVLGQEMRWIDRHELRSLQFPEADRELIDVLTATPPAP